MNTEKTNRFNLENVGGKIETVKIGFYVTVCIFKYVDVLWVCVIGLCTYQTWRVALTFSPLQYIDDHKLHLFRPCLLW
jgi:hypothetical protein